MRLLALVIGVLAICISCSKPKEIPYSFSGTYIAEVADTPQADRIFLQLDYDSTHGWTAFFHRPLQEQYKIEGQLKLTPAGFNVTDSSGNELVQVSVADDSISDVFIAQSKLPAQRIGDFDENFAPQSPRPPYPYQMDSITFTNPADSVTLAGTLTVPRGTGPFPTILFITGSGPQDRDETIGFHHTFAVIADWLARAGIASLRFDDRGMGGSGGTTEQIDIFTYATDVQAALDFISKQEGIDTNRLGLLGHSEGGAVAPLVATRDPRPDYLILLAPMNLPGDTIMIVQGERIRDVYNNPDSINRANKMLQRGLFKLVKEAEVRNWSDDRLQQELDDYVASIPDSLIRPLGLTEVSIQQIIKGVATAPMRRMITYDPRPVIRQLTIPILALFGSKDLQVPADICAPAMEADLAQSNAPVKFVETVPEANHLFQKAKTGYVLEYFANAETIQLKVLRRITDFIKNQATP